MIDFEIKLDPKGLQRLAGKMQQYVNALQTSSEKALKEVGEIYYALVIEYVGKVSPTTGGRVFDVTWLPLSETWLREKQRRGFVEEIWEAESLIRVGIKIYGTENIPGGGIQIFVGLKDDGPASSYDFKTAFEKAIRNEFGAGIPARPLFEPAKREMLRGKNRTEITEAFKRAAKAAYQSFAYGKP